MSAEPTPPKASQPPAVEHVEGAHDLLKALRSRIGEHPELSEAITRLEMALNALTLNTGGML
jgi:Lon protease-like protein